MPYWVLFLALAFSASLQRMTEEEAADLAMETLLEELRVKKRDLEIVSTLPVKWPDSSLGCPMEGQPYVQEAVAGYRVVFRNRGRVYRVHVGDGRAVLCSRPGKEPRFPGGKEGLAAAMDISRLAREDLASRLGVDIEEIALHFIEPTTWPDASLGCPEEGMMYAQVETPGYLIELMHEGRAFEYHSDMRKPFLCEKKKP